MLEPIRPRPIMPSCMGASGLNEKNVNGEQQPDQGQNSGQDHRRLDVQRRGGDSPFQIADIAMVALRRDRDNSNANANHAHSKPCRDTWIDRDASYLAGGAEFTS